MDNQLELQLDFSILCSVACPLINFGSVGSTGLSQVRNEFTFLNVVIWNSRWWLHSEIQKQQEKVQMALAEFPITGPGCLKLLPQLALYVYTWCYCRVHAKKFLVQLKLEEMSQMNTVSFSCFYIQFNCCDTFVGWVTLEAVGSRARKVQSTGFHEGSKESPHKVSAGIYEAFQALWKTVILIYQLIYGYIYMSSCKQLQRFCDAEK